MDLPLDQQLTGHMPYREIIRKYYRKRVMLVDLEYFMNLHKITYHKISRKYRNDRPSVTGLLRTLSVETATGVSLNIGKNSVKEETYTPGDVAMHTLDENCVVIPNLKQYVGAYRFMPIDDVPTIPSRNMGYFRCPNLILAVSLSMWLRHPDVVLETNREFGRKRRMKTMELRFFERIPVPEEVLDYEIVKRAMEIDASIEKHLLELEELVDSMEDLCVLYAK